MSASDFRWAGLPAGALRRERFHVPVGEDGRDIAYLTGNSLGLQPVGAAAVVDEAMRAWRERAVEGHFTGERPWFRYDERLRAPLGRIVGALEHEVAVMGSLTANLHLLMASFYRPTGRRRLIVIEPGAFPSDRYAVASQARWHGLDEDTVIELDAAVEPGGGGDHGLVDTERACAQLRALGDDVAMVLLGGVHWVTGQRLDVRALTATAHEIGAIAGWDLAHAAGNVPLALHGDDVDFAAWCSYKYLNAGPGATAGIFVHERHARDPERLRLAGWWGNDPATRFGMPDRFVPAASAASWMVSNAPVLSMAPLIASLEVFDDVGMAALRERSVALTARLEALVHDAGVRGVRQLTPAAADARGCALSFQVAANAAELVRSMQQDGVQIDARPPDVIRVAPCPLYTTEDDLTRFAESLSRAVTLHR